MRSMGKIALGTAAAGGLAQGVSASANFTAVSTLITDTIPVFEAIADLVIGIAPTLIILAIVGFVLLFLKTILGAVKKAI